MGQPEVAPGDLLLVAVGGALGAVARGALTALLGGTGLAAVALVDVTGAAALGALARRPGRRVRLLWGTGALGSWTSVSALAAAGPALADERGVGVAALATAVVVAGGVAAAVVARRGRR